jgi:hypothetical protein
MAGLLDLADSLKGRTGRSLGALVTIIVALATLFAVQFASLINVSESQFEYIFVGAIVIWAIASAVYIFVIPIHSPVVIPQGPFEPLPTSDFEALRWIGKTTAKSGVFDVLEPGNDMAAAPMQESRIVWPKGWNMKLWMQHISGPPLTVTFPYARNGNDYELRNADRLTTSADDNVKGPLLFRNYTGAEAVWFVYSGADERKPSEVAFVIQLIPVAELL